MYNSKTQTATKNEEKEVTTPNSVSSPEKENVSDHLKNDKRYEEPFENDGAYADDDDND